MGRQEWTPPRRGFDEHMGYYDGCGTRYTHVQSCCGYQPDQRNAGGTNPYPAAGVPFNPGDGWGNPVPGEHARKYVCAYNLSNPAAAGGLPAYDWQDTGPTPVGGCPQEGCTSTPDVSVNGTGSCDLIRDRAVGFIERVGKDEAPYFLYLPFQNIHCPYTVGERSNDPGPPCPSSVRRVTCLDFHGLRCVCLCADQKWIDLYEHIPSTTDEKIMCTPHSLLSLVTSTGVFGPSRLTGRCPPQGATSARWTMPSAQSTARSRHSALVAWPTRS